jgi:hypothetical protein
MTSAIVLSQLGELVAAGNKVKHRDCHDAGSNYSVAQENHESKHGIHGCLLNPAHS